MAFGYKLSSLTLRRRRLQTANQCSKMDIVTFVELDGNPPQEPADGQILSLGSLRDQHLATHRNGSLEPSTLEGIELHFKHLLGLTTPFTSGCR